MASIRNLPLSPNLSPDVVRAARRRLALAVGDLARLADVEPDIVRALEAGEPVADIREVERVADLLGLRAHPRPAA